MRSKLARVILRFAAWLAIKIDPEHGRDAVTYAKDVERHVQDMEKALERIISLMSSSEESWEDPVLIARAALSASGTAT